MVISYFTLNILLNIENSPKRLLCFLSEGFEVVLNGEESGFLRGNLVEPIEAYCQTCSPRFSFS